MFSIFLLLRHHIALGIFITCISLFASMQERLEQVMMFTAVLSRETMFVSDYFKFMEYEEPKKLPDAKDEPLEELRAENISYKYANVEFDALSEVSLTAKKGDIIAVVGENGSGKSTLAKILTGLYEPSRGRYIVNGTEFTKWDRDSFHRRTAVVYQDFVKYQLTFRENIAFGELTKLNDDESLYEAVKSARVDGVISENGGLDSVVGRTFGTTDLSGGEWQRLAIARGFINSDSEFFIVDEPTASIDPIAEDETFSDLIAHMGDKIAVIITHRMGIARKASQIIVLDHGKVVETGTHNELIKKRGEYYRLLNLQAKWYESSKV